MGRTEKQLKLSLMRVAEAYLGRRGIWLYEAFDKVNATLFDNALPQPFITIQLTAHGRCLGLMRPTERPQITLHPSTFGGTESSEPWGVPEWMLGARYALDVLIHEATHVSVDYVLGGANGPTSHDNPRWIAEVNRICPLLGIPGVQAGRPKSTRVEIPGQFTKTGKPATKVTKKCEGNVPFSAAAKYPHSIRRELGLSEDFYRTGVFPFDIDLSV